MNLRSSMPFRNRVLLPIVARFVMGLFVAAAVGVWFLPINTMTPPSMVLCAGLSAAALGLACIVVRRLRDVNAWVEFDGTAIRWKSLLTGRVRARPATEILHVRVEHPPSWGTPKYGSAFGPAYFIVLVEGAPVRIEPEAQGSPQLIAAIQATGSR